MFPMKVKINAGTLDIKEYDFNKNIFIGSNNKEYSIDEIEYFLIPTVEIKKILNISNDISEDSRIKSSSRNKNYSR